MRIDLDSILWRTRGREWDYSFVLRPTHPHIETWYDFHTDVFAWTTPGTAPSVTGGFLSLGDGDEVPFIATSFQDSMLRDAVGRPIAHYLIWFPNTRGRPTDYEVTADWGAQVVRAFGDEWGSAFAGDGTSEGDLLATARSLLKEVALVDGEAVRVALKRDVVEKKKPPAGSRMRKSTRWLLLALTVVGVLLLLLLGGLTCG